MHEEPQTETEVDVDVTTTEPATEEEGEKYDGGDIPGTDDAPAQGDESAEVPAE